VKQLKSIFLIAILAIFSFSCEEEATTSTGSSVKITKFAPSTASVGDDITITGEGFGTVVANVSVKVNGTTAAVKSVTNTSIVATLGAGTTTGKVEVTVGSNKGSSAGNLVIRTISELVGTKDGTLEAGEYQLKGNLVVPEGKTLIIKPGVKIVAFGNSTSSLDSPEITVNGTLIAEGTADNPIIFTVESSKRTDANIHKGLWGGIQASPTCPELRLKYVRMEYVGGPAGAGSTEYEEGDPRYGVWYNNVDGKCIIEDCWFYSSTDDAMRMTGGKISICRNIFELCGSDGGDVINIKSGTVGVIAYNFCIGAATNALKVSNSGGTTVQANVDIYNNTVLNGGFRRAKSGRGGSINIEAGAKGQIYNNLVVNCRFGFRIVGGADIADTANTKYGNNFHYATYESFVTEMIPVGSLAVKKNTDIMGAAKANNPGFVNYNVDQFTENDYRSAQPKILNTIGSFDFRLTSNSMAKGKGNTAFTPVLTSLTNASIELPGTDLGCFQSNGTGNKLYTWVK
jgi:hypothetical protein